MIILGIDPGLANTGWGVVEQRGSSSACLAYGCVTTRPRLPFASDCRRCTTRCSKSCPAIGPTSARSSRVFFGTNAKSAFATGQARGVALLATVEARIDIAEYSPVQVKHAVVGSGSADKRQVQYMVRTLLGLDHDPSPDHASDALAVALCHASLRGRRSLERAAYGARSRAPLGQGARMIAFLTGRVAGKSPNSCLLEVSGVGYRLAMSTSSVAALPAEGDEVTVWTYLYVREDELSLYGFESVAEKDAFEQLITVSGVGPKVALATLSALSADDLAGAVAAEDVALLSGVPGIGKKTAQRICLELKDKMGVPELACCSAGKDRRGGASAEATEALLSMGFSSAEVAAALKGFDGEPPMRRSCFATLSNASEVRVRDRRGGAGRVVPPRRARAGWQRCAPWASPSRSRQACGWARCSPRSLTLR